MSENKQTLFRFKTMRAPNAGTLEVPVINDSRSLILHGSGTFYDKVANRLSSQTVLDAMKSVTSTFTPLTLAELQAIKPALSSLASYIAENRNTAEYSVINMQMSLLGRAGLDSEDLDRVWDNLFYQTVTMKSTAIREELLKLLVAHHLVTSFGTISTDDDVRRYAKARVVLPSQLFVNVNEYPNATISVAAQPNTPLLLKHMTTAESQLNVQTATTALAELKKFKTKYFKTNVPLETAANVAYLKTVGDVIKRTTPEIARDPLTGELQKVIDPAIPAPSFVAKPEVDSTALTTNLSTPSFYLVDKLGLSTSSTFEQVEKGLKEYIKEHQDQIFKNTGFHVERLAVNGMMLPKCSVETRFNPNYSYMLKPVLTKENNYKFLLVVDLGSSCLKVESLNVDIDAAGISTQTDYKFSNKDGIATIDITPKGGLNIVPVTNPEINIELQLSNGFKLVTNNGQSLNFAKEYLAGVLSPIQVDSTRGGAFVPSGFGLTRVGISDYRRVEQTLCCYVPGEVSHIENVMAREYKERSTRRLRRSEDTTTQTSSSEKERMSDTSTTSRYDMQQEVSSVLTQSQEHSRDVSFNASLSGTAKLPFVGEAEFSLGSDFASNNSSSSSQENSNSQSVTFAKEVTEKVTDRVVAKVSQERIQKVVEEFEEQNRHGFDNRQGSEHISGVYRWVDKIYKNQVFNYGKRLQYEFMIPEPASFHLATKVALTESGQEIPVREPHDPRLESFGTLPALTHAGLVTESNYQQWAAAYGATVTAPPDEIKLVSRSLIKQEGGDYSVTKVMTEDIPVPEGYGIRRIWYSAMGNGSKSSWESYMVAVGCATGYLWGEMFPRMLLADSTTLPGLEMYTESIPASVQFTCVEGGMVSIELELVRKSAHLAEWQMDTFNAIIDAYQERLEEYKNTMAEIAAQKVRITADNPAYLRRIENTVLKKNCIAYLIGHLNMGKNFIGGNSTATTHVNLTESMDKYAATVKFFEQAFEWDLMEYRFYPFYWADRTRWNNLYNLDNDDALFRSFLQAGMARTMLTVRPGFEEAVMFYMSTGLIWNGGDTPALNDPLYLSIVNELASPEYFIEDTWETRLPSTLTLIQAKTIALNAEGLPCYCDDNEAPEETIGQPDVDPLGGLNVFIPGSTTTEE